MSGDTDIVVHQPTGGEVSRPRTAKDILAHVRLIEEVKAAVMKDGVHYGTIPGCGDKPTLLKPGAEKLIMAFQLCTDHEIDVQDLGNGHREYRVRTPVRTPGGVLLATGVGSCSTMESKYRWRDSSKKCPTCGKAAIIKGKEEYGGGWICFKKKDGCGAKFADGDKSIESQPSGRTENPDIADTYNTVLKMALKRSSVDGALKATGSSDFFAQDLEDIKGQEERTEKEEKGSVDYWLRGVAACRDEAAIKTTRADAWGWISDVQARNRITSACVKRAEEIRAAQRAQPEQEMDFDTLIGAGSEGGQGAAEAAHSAEAPTEPAASSKAKGPRSFSGLSKGEWEALPDEEQTKRGDISRKQLVALSNLAKRMGLGEAEVMQTFRVGVYAKDYAGGEMANYWQLSGAMASATISEFSAAK